MLNKFKLALVGVLSLACGGMAGRGAAGNIALINANIASEYVVTSMPIDKSPGCPMVGSIRFFAGGTLTGNFVTDMARSKSIPFTGSYTLTGGANITFSSDVAQVPLRNMNGTIVRSAGVTFTKNVQANRRNPPPIDYLVITAHTAQCVNGVYKLTLTLPEE